MFRDWVAYDSGLWENMLCCRVVPADKRSVSSAADHEGRFVLMAWLYARCAVMAMRLGRGLGSRAAAPDRSKLSDVRRNKGTLSR